MLKKRLGTTLLEWIVVVVVIVAVIGTVIFTLAGNAALKGTAIGAWITGLQVPGG
jgi:hypothetical protein